MGEMLYFYGLFIEKGNLFASKKRTQIVFLNKNHFFKKHAFSKENQWFAQQIQFLCTNK